jgi:hypothetical protein
MKNKRREEHIKNMVVNQKMMMYLELLDQYEPTGTNGYNRHAYIVRDYILYPYNLYAGHNDKLNSFDDEDKLINYIIDNNLKKQR